MRLVVFFFVVVMLGLSAALLYRDHQYRALLDEVVPYVERQRDRIGELEHENRDLAQQVTDLTTHLGRERTDAVLRVQEFNRVAAANDRCVLRRKDAP